MEWFARCYQVAVRFVRTGVIAFSAGLTGFVLLSAAIAAPGLLWAIDVDIWLVLAVFAQGLIGIVGLGLILGALAIVVADVLLDHLSRQHQLHLRRGWANRLLVLLLAGGTLMATVGSYLGPIVLAEVARYRAIASQESNLVLVIWLGAIGVAGGLAIWWHEQRAEQT